MKKRGQITIFIIIGVILLFSSALIIYIKSQIVMPVREVKVAVEMVPTEVRPLQIYISECIEKTATDAVLKIGMKGGYIATSPDDPDIDVSGKTFIVNPTNPTEADAVPFPPDSNNYVVYWNYMKSPNDCSECIFSSLRPPLYRDQGESSIEAQIDRYVNKHLKECLGNFEPFAKEGLEIKELAEIKTTSYVTERDLQIQVDYPIEARKGEERWQLNKFAGSVDVNLKKIYDLATYIIAKENEARFLGLHTMNLIAAFSRIDERMLPPLGGMRFEFKTLRWTKIGVQEKIRQMLESYVPILQIDLTTNFFDPVRFRDPITRGLYENTVLPGKRLGIASVNFLYLGWPVYVDFSGAELLTPQTLDIPIINLLPIKDYTFVYDLSYPVVVRIDDSSAFSNRGFLFFFTLEVNIRNNELVNETFIPVSTLRSSESVSQFCDPKQRSSGIIAIKTFDKVTNAPLEDVNIRFKGSQECSIGTTRIDNNRLSPYYQNAVVADVFPVGLGTLTLSRQNYSTVIVPFGTTVDKSGEFDFYLEPIKELNANIMKLKLNKIAAPFLSLYAINETAEKPTEDEIIVVSLQKIKERPSEEDLVSVVKLEKGAIEGTVKLVPGNYQVNIMAFLNKTVILPETEECSGGGFFGIGKKCVKIPEIRFDVFPENTVEFNWSVGDEIYKANNVTFLVIVPETPTNHDEFKAISQSLKTYNSAALNLYAPRFD